MQPSGVITITNEECTYDYEDDLVSHPSAGHLSQIVGHDIHHKHSNEGFKEFRQRLGSI